MINKLEKFQALTPISTYLDNILNIDNLDNILYIGNPYFEGMVNQIYQPELHLNNSIVSVIEAQFLEFYLSISNGFVLSKVYEKHDDFHFDRKTSALCLNGNVSCRFSLTGFTFLNVFGLLECNHVTDFSDRGNILNAKLLQQSHPFHKLQKASFSNFIDDNII